ncbi:hypothetical protein GYMLUDRAFT_245135 [Collybiopsis luxurians FD-317 M1]|uniref:Mucoidy inhibitor A n=1 Tax=Collybiopsis luxurians FD-317 M1 TaxID=944289 RepID=A0A0D0CUF7_9AGAR|nr:hypothetical protein GYMLUDRAFT_245135 [Collybiopsis luxurians FD-317 M1]
MTTLPPYAANTITLVSLIDSKLLHVSLYTGRAELHRLFKFNVQTGQNQLYINGLPNVIQEDSLRVQGHGDATIHDVSLLTMPREPSEKTSPLLQQLLTKKDLVQSAISRCQISSRALESYIRSMTVNDVHLNQVGEFINSYSVHGSKLDEELAKLKQEEDELYREISTEKARIRKEQVSGDGSLLLGMQVAVGLFAENEGEIELELVYAVSSANWEAVYDIRVDLEAKENPLTLVYKAAIVQDTGEDWTNVPLTLETATPSYGVQIPKLKPLKLSTSRPYHPYPYAAGGPMVVTPGGAAPIIPLASVQPVIISRSRFRSRSRSPPSRRSSRSPTRSVRHRHYERSPRSSRSPSRSPRRRSPVRQPPPRVLGTVGLNVASKGDGRFNHSVFQVPGLISVPCDGMAHKVTVVELKELETKLLWLAVPKKDTRVHLNAKIKNTSEYVLIPGSASVYVDGTFIARSSIPAAGPDESFDCSLGLDSSIKITYHPLSSKVSHRTPFTGFTGINSLSSFGTTKTTSTLYSQRITILNTKRVRIDALKLIDRIPVSEDERIVVKILKPAELNRPGKGSGVNNNQTEAGSNTGKVASDSKNAEDAASVTTSSSKVVTMKKRFSTSKRLPSFSSGSGRRSFDNSTGAQDTIVTPPTSALNSAPVQFPLDRSKVRVIAQWDGADADKELPPLPNNESNATENGVKAAGKEKDKEEETSGAKSEGKMNWLLYHIPAQGTVNLVMEWEVSAASSLPVVEWEP